MPRVCLAAAVLAACTAGDAIDDELAPVADDPIELSDLGALIDRDARSFAALGAAGRLRPGTELPAPTGVFPRYVEPKDDAEKNAEPKPKGKPPRT